MMMVVMMMVVMVVVVMVVMNKILLMNRDKMRRIAYGTKAMRLTIVTLKQFFLENSFLLKR